MVSVITPLTLANNDRITNEKDIQSTTSSDGLMDSPWPMYCHDIRHTGRSPYSTASNTGFEKWFFKRDSHVLGSGVIDKDGVIYFGGWGGYAGFYALYPNGTVKWKIVIDGWVESSPAIDKNGIIYIGTWSGIEGDYLYAFYPNSTLKWKYFSGDDIYSSPAIGNDGTIIFADSGNWRIIALYPNGTLKWSFQTNYVVHSSPAIGDDGTVYCGSHDGNLYALYPNNGTLKWKYQTGDWVARGPSIADDGTIYFGSWDGYLYAVYPDGSLKWKTGGYLAGTTPVTAQDGTIYVGNNYLTAIYPNNGSVKWTFEGGSIAGSNPCISADGTIYFGTHYDSELIAVNPDGTLKWRKNIGGTCEFDPLIGEDGTIYIGSSHDQKVEDGYVSIGYLHAFNDLDPNAPSAPQIKGKNKIIPRITYKYTFKSTSPLGNDLYYWINWGDKALEEWIGPITSGEEITVSHRWDYKGTYIIRAKVKDTDNLWGPWSELKVTTPKNKFVNFNSLFLKLAEQFPFLERLPYIFS